MSDKEKLNPSEQKQNKINWEAWFPVIFTVVAAVLMFVAAKFLG